MASSHVSAKDLATKKEQRITITAPHKLSQEDIDAKIKDAERFAADDLKRKEEIEVKNAAESLIYASRKMLKEAGDIATSEQKEKIEKAISDLKNAQTGGEISEIKAKTESLQNAIYDHVCRHVPEGGAGSAGPAGTGRPGLRPGGGSGFHSRIRRWTQITR